MALYIKETIVLSSRDPFSTFIFVGGRLLRLAFLEWQHLFQGLLYVGLGESIFIVDDDVCRAFFSSPHPKNSTEIALHMCSNIGT